MKYKKRRSANATLPCGSSFALHTLSSCGPARPLSRQAASACPHPLHRGYRNTRVDNAACVGPYLCVLYDGSPASGNSRFQGKLATGLATAVHFSCFFLMSLICHASQEMKTVQVGCVEGLPRSRLCCRWSPTVGTDSNRNAPLLLLIHSAKCGYVYPHCSLMPPAAARCIHSVAMHSLHGRLDPWRARLAYASHMDCILQWDPRSVARAPRSSQACVAGHMSCAAGTRPHAEAVKHAFSHWLLSLSLYRRRKE